jgi:hypothetical protein
MLRIIPALAGDLGSGGEQQQHRQDGSGIQARDLGSWPDVPRRRGMVWCVRVVQKPSQEGDAMMAQETGTVTGTKDKDYNLIWYVEACLSNALRLETYINDAAREGDSELADLFRKAQADSRKGAEMGKQMLRSRLAS